jgi:hypothetical protein
LLVLIGQSKQHRCKPSLSRSRHRDLDANLAACASGLNVKRIRNVLRSLTPIVIDQFLEHVAEPESGLRSNFDRHSANINGPVLGIHHELKRERYCKTLMRHRLQFVARVPRFRADQAS